MSARVCLSVCCDITIQSHNHIQVAPMSLYSMLGSHGVTVRDVFVRRLSAKTEDVDLKVAIVEFITVAIETQPALTELFLCLKPSNENNGTEVAYNKT